MTTGRRHNADPSPDPDHEKDHQPVTTTSLTRARKQRPPRSYVPRHSLHPTRRPSRVDQIRATLAPLASHEPLRNFLSGLAVTAAIVGLYMLLLVLRAVTR